MGAIGWKRVLAAAAFSLTLAETPAGAYIDLDGKSHELVRQGGSAVIDTSTWLMWEIKEGSDGIEDYNKPNDPDNKYSQTENGPQDVGSFVSKLNQSHFAGFSDWRMPTLMELRGIIDADGSAAPFVDVNYFPDISGEKYWTSTEGYYENGYYFVNFYEILKYVDPVSNGNFTSSLGGADLLFARAVRQLSQEEINNLLGIPPINERFTDSMDGGIIDHYLQIMWFKDASGECLKAVPVGSDQNTAPRGGSSYIQALEKIVDLNARKLQCAGYTGAYDNSTFGVGDFLS